MSKWFAVADRDACDLEDDVWTISRDANVTGWNTDSGHNGYGLKFEDAEKIVAVLNSANALREENECLRKTLLKIEKATVPGTNIYEIAHKMNWVDNE